MSRMLSRCVERAITQFRISNHPLRCLSANDPCGLRGGPFETVPAKASSTQNVRQTSMRNRHRSTMSGC